MDIYKAQAVSTLLEGNTYPGRGIIAGTTPDGKNGVSAYFIMGRSANSRNRVFVKKGNELFTEPFDASKVEDPSLIIYAAVREFEKSLIVTNGDQTDTIVEAFKKGKCSRHALMTREFEPDAPNYTPRISAVLDFDGEFNYELSILKSIDGKGSGCARYFFRYPSLAGLGHFIHTYVCDGNPIPTFQGEPERVQTNDDIDVFTDEVWNALDKDNRISLYVRYTNLESGEYVDRIINKNS